MALAWIAWRDIESVRAQIDEFTSECTQWIWREWNELVNNGTEYARRKGWFLENWRRPTAVLLATTDIFKRSRNALPATAKTTVREAKTALWRALSDGHLVAEGFNADGKLIEIPAMEWAHLELFEDGKRDVFRYDALDRTEPYTKVKFRRDELLQHWPPPILTTKAATDCERWLCDQMRQSPSRKPHPKEQFFHDAQRLFKPISKRQFDTLWQNAMTKAGADAWRKAGAPKKSNHRTK
jgi:hypothetical protein